MSFVSICSLSSYGKYLTKGLALAPINLDMAGIIADVRNPLLHVPDALYEHCTTTLRKRLVIVLTKVWRHICLACNLRPY